MLCLYEPHDRINNRGQIHMKRHQFGYGVALLVGLAVAGLGTGALAQSAGKSASDTVTSTVTTPGSTAVITETMPATTTMVTTTAPAPPTTTANDDNEVEDVPGPCDEAEHANDAQCTGVGAVNPAADDDDAAENEAEHQNRGPGNNGEDHSGPGRGQDDNQAENHSGHGNGNDDAANHDANDANDANDDNGGGNGGGGNGGGGDDNGGGHGGGGGQDD